MQSNPLYSWSLAERNIQCLPFHSQYRCLPLISLVLNSLIQYTGFYKSSWHALARNRFRITVQRKVMHIFSLSFQMGSDRNHFSMCRACTRAPARTLPGRAAGQPDLGSSAPPQPPASLGCQPGGAVVSFFFHFEIDFEYV